MMNENEIVFIYGRHENGGAQRHAVVLANEFSKKGYKVFLLALRGTVGGTTKSVFYNINENVEIILLPNYVQEHENDSVVLADKRHQNKLLYVLKHLRYLTKFAPALDEGLKNRIKAIRAGSALRSFLVLHQDATLCAFGMSAYEATCYASQGMRCKRVFVEITAPQLYLQERHTDLQHVSYLMNQADCAVFQTEDEKACFKSYISKTFVIHNPLCSDLPLCYMGKRRADIVNFCRMAPEKNIPLLISAFEMLHREYPEYRLLIYGNAVSEREVAYREEIRKRIQESEAHDSILMLPPEKNIHEIIRDCAMFVSSSDFEGLSNSMLEAMAIGLPCVCTDCHGGGAREVIKDRENGILVPVGDENALYEGMKLLIDSPELAQRCSQNAVKIRDELSNERVAELWTQAIGRKGVQI